MKNIKSSRAFENLKPSEEQKKVIYNSLKNEVVKNNNDIIVKNDGVKIIKRKKINIKNVIYPSLAAIVIVGVFAKVIYGHMGNILSSDNNILSSGDNSLSSSEVKTDIINFDSSMSYTAEQINEHPDGYLCGAFGTYNGKFYSSALKMTYTTSYGLLSDWSSDKTLLNEKGDEIENVTDAFSSDKIFIAVADNQNRTSVCVYNSDLSEMLFSLFNDPQTLCVKIAQGNDKNSVYALCTDSDNKNINIQKRNYEDEITGQIYLKDCGCSAEEIKDILVMESGDVAVLCSSSQDRDKSINSECSISICIFDSELNYKTTVTANRMNCTFSELTESNNKLYMVSDEAFENESQLVQNTCIDLVDIENKTLIPQPCSIPQSSVSHQWIKYIRYNNLNNYNFLYLSENEDDTLYGYRINDNTSEKITDGLSYGSDVIIDIGEELYCFRQQFYYNEDILSSINNDDVVIQSERRYEPKICYREGRSILPDGHLQQWYKLDPDNYYGCEIDYSSETDYNILNIDPDTGLFEISNINTDEEIIRCLEKDEYIAVLSYKYDKIKSTSDNILKIFNKDGTLLYTLQPDNGVINDIFLTAENKLIATIYDKKTKEWSGSEVDVKSGTMNNINVSWPKFYGASDYMTGSDGYSVFFILDGDVYGAVLNDSDYICEKIIESSNIDFPDESFNGNIRKFGYDKNGCIYLETDDDNIYRLKEK